MRIAGFLQDSTVNGPGLRFVIFTQGCSHHCKSCHNSETWGFDGGKDMTIDDIIKEIKKSMPLIKGVTLSGGDPLDQPKETFNLLKEIKDKLKLNTWLYTGYVVEDLDEEQKKCIQYIDTIVDGPYVEQLTKDVPKYVGSCNQRILNTKDLRFL